MARKSVVKRVERPGSRWRAIRATSRANDEAFWGEPVLLGRGSSKRGAKELAYPGRARRVRRRHGMPVR